MNTGQRLPNNPHIEIFTIEPRSMLTNANSPYIHELFTENSKKKRLLSHLSVYVSQKTFSVLMTIYYNILRKKIKGQ